MGFIDRIRRLKSRIARRREFSRADEDKKRCDSAADGWHMAICLLQAKSCNFARLNCSKSLIDF